MNNSISNSTGLASGTFLLEVYYSFDEHWRSYHWGVTYVQVISAAIGLSLWFYIALKGHEGASSIIVKAPVTMFSVLTVLYSISWAMWDRVTTNIGRWEWHCYTNYQYLRSIWTAINTFLLSLIVPSVLNMILLWKMPDIEVSMNWRNLTFSYLEACVYYYIFDEAPNIIRIFSRLQSDLSKMLFRLVVIPILNFMGYKLAIWNARKLKLKDKSDDFYYCLFFLLLCGMYSRFLQNSLSSYSSIVTVVSLNGLQELIFRFTFKHRNTWIQKYIFGKSDEEIKSLEDNQEAREAVGRVILMEMLVEYICIFLALLLQLCNQKNAFHFKLGYNIDGSMDTQMLLFSTFASLFVELVIDAICFKYQERHYRLKEAWVSMTGGNKMWLKVYPMFTIQTVMVTAFLLGGFNQSPALVAPDRCAFVTKCLPYPCSQCYNVTLFNSTESILPPVFEDLCYRLSNSSSPLYNETIQWEIFKTNSGYLQGQSP